MYREPSDREQFGTSEGPYAGPVKNFAMDELPLHVREAFAATLEGKKEPKPLLVSEQPGRRRALFGMVLLLLGIVPGAFVMAGGGTSPTEPSVHAIARFLLLALLCTLVGQAVWGLVQRLRLERWQGFFLLPLDLVEIRGERVRLIPMGHLRRVNIERLGRRESRCIVLTFEDGAAFPFAVASEGAAQAAHKAIVHAQGVLKSLTIMPDLAQTVALDPFFALRSDPMWTALGTSTSRGGVSVHIWRALAMAGVGGALAASFYFAMREWREPLPTVMSMPEAPAVEGSGSAAESPSDLGWAAHRRRRSELSVAEAMARDQAQLRVRERLLAHGTPGGAEMVESFLEHADLDGDPFVYIEQRNVLRGTPVPYPGWDGDGPEGWELERHMAKVAQSFAVALSQDVPTHLLEIVLVPNGGDAPKGASVISVQVALQQKAQATAFVFTVSVNHRERFTLTMPPPSKPLHGVRDKSLFPLPTADHPSKREKLLLDARAFDRLYDELFGLFFVGDPIILTRGGAGP